MYLTPLDLNDRRQIWAFLELPLRSRRELRRLIPHLKEGKLQYRVGDFVQIDTTNENMLRKIANFGVEFCKRHRIYVRALN